MKKTSLNHRYRLVWSRVQDAFVAVAEHIKSDGKNATAVHNNNQAVSSFQSMSIMALTKKTLLGLVVISALFGATQNANAQWTDLVIQSGQATSQQTGNNFNLNVTTSHVIGVASSLDIAANESVNVFFTQGDGQGLFRSTGNSATNIMGGLTSNGNLFLINQNGVLFGQGAQVDVGGLVASSMNISNADFLNGNYQFNANGSSGGVNNQGVIKVSDGGYLVMLGKEVKNSGTLIANNGSVVMASADSAVLDFYGNGLIKAKLSGDALEAVVAQAGNVQADGGTVQIATNSRSSAINVSGITQANSLVEHNGVIRLEGGDHARVSVSGTLSAKGNQANTTGGNIEVTGEQVALFSGANLDASGNAGGGQVLVGGDYQGKNIEAYNARTAYVDQAASIKVDASETGNGGKAIVWADDTTRYYGDISAKGGTQSGNGGFVEVSGKQNLDFIGRVDVSAANGLGGNVLLDPENIILNTSAQTPPPNNADGTPDLAFSDAPDPGTTTIQIADITGFSELFLQATNDITVANNITMVTNNSIRLEANNNLNVNGQIFTQGTGNIDLKADADSSGVGDLTLNRRVFSRQGDITLSGANVTSVAAGQILTQGLVGQDSGNVSITASNLVNLAGSIVTNGRNGTGVIAGGNAGMVNINAAGAISTANIAASGGHGGTGGNTVGGNGGYMDIVSTGVGDITTGNITSRNGAG
ncbi:MAG: filamentous hemagglutinin N-terminal domain-containing protein, partial [Methylophilaceae bacterium]